MLMNALDFAREKIDALEAAWILARRGIAIKSVKIQPAFK
jgi:hypothetical protein